LQDRWEQGCTNISQLCREIVGKGYTGSRSLVNTALLPWRSPRSLTTSGKTTKRRSSVRWLCLRPPDQLDPRETTLLNHILAANPLLARGHDLLQRFRQVLRERSVVALDAWIVDARESGLRSFEAFANGILSDRSAVEAGLTTTWSNGPVEGHVHKIKLIKRQGYGRAKVDLLRPRSRRLIAESVAPLTDRSRGPFPTSAGEPVVAPGLCGQAAPQNRVTTG
jgi:transposase